MATKPPAGTVWAPVAWEPADARAIQNVMAGNASHEQQIRAMQWILLRAAAVDDFQYRLSDRDTAFSLGRAFVGQQIKKLCLVNLSRIKDGQNDGDNGSNQ
jgi:hypothetical protein